jgi:hypothetical protein
VGGLEWWGGHGVSASHQSRLRKMDETFLKDIEDCYKKATMVGRGDMLYRRRPL